jgi:CRISPR-associated helicase Cas3/CRISPR-associated endonuclease Cas3-HD
MKFFAKSKLPDGHQPTVKDHTDSVSKLAEEYGRDIGCEKEARLAGKLHDFGKYGQCFQDVLNGTQTHIDHAICGASFLHHCLSQNILCRYYPIMESINGHHDGLIEMDLLEPRLLKNMQQLQPIENHEGKYSALSGKLEYQKATEQFFKDNPEWKCPKIKNTYPSMHSSIESMLYTRMIFSCLVDADYSTSAIDEDKAYLTRSESLDFNPETVLQSLYDYKSSICKNSDANAAVNRIRNKLFDICGEMGDGPEGLYTLTAPTGTGKTLALLHFALRHCIKTGKKRIIIVLPFLTLTEQNANTYRKIYADLLEDHSQSKLTDDERQLAARWSAPIIITTSVRFFESLFSNRPTDCRKLHHIANSVVVFDESQSLPADLQSATIQTVNELCKRYHTTMVFSTATQPKFDVLEQVEWHPTEINSDHTEMYNALRRTYIEWRMKDGIRTPLEQIAKEMSEETSVCTIVNLREHAKKLYQALKKYCSEDEIFYLTADLCPAHRMDVVFDIKNRLQHKQPCRVVATQCIEAGVDFDFDVLYRALAPLEAIIQAAGRCNRNDRIPERGRVIVFIPDENASLYPGNWYEHAAHIVEQIVHDHPIDICNTADMDEYYRMLFSEAKDKPSLTEAIRNHSFQIVDKEYKIIDDRGYRVIVPYKRSDYTLLRQEMENYGISKKMIKELTSITVTVGYEQKKLLEKTALPIYYCERGRITKRESGFYILLAQNESDYTSDMGLLLSEKDLIGF